MFACPASKTKTLTLGFSVRRAASVRPAVCNRHGCIQYLESVNSIKRRTPPPAQNKYSAPVHSIVVTVLTSNNVVEKLVVELLSRNNHGVECVDVGSERRG